MEQVFLEDMFLTITKPTFELLLKEKDFSSLYSLYSFYYYTAKWQGTNQPKCTTIYTAKGLHWNERKVIKYKKRLIELDLIEDISTRGESNKITGHYIKVKYILKKTTELKIQEKEEQESSQTAVSSETTHPVRNVQGGSEKPTLYISAGVAKSAPKCLKSNNLNALSINIKNKKKKKTNETEFNENFEKLWGLLKPTANDRKNKVTKKRKKELYEMGFVRTENAIKLYLKVQDPKFLHKRDNFLNDIIDNYLDKEVKDFDLSGKTDIESEPSYNIDEYENDWKNHNEDMIKAFMNKGKIVSNAV